MAREPRYQAVKTLKTLDGLKRVMQRAVEQRHLDCMTVDKILEVIRHHSSSVDRGSTGHMEARKLQAQCEAYRQILNAYALLLMLNRKDVSDCHEADIGGSRGAIPERPTIKGVKDDEQEVASKLSLDPELLLKYQRDLELHARLLSNIPPASFDGAMEPDLFHGTAGGANDTGTASQLSVQDMIGCIDVAGALWTSRLSRRPTVEDDAPSAEDVYPHDHGARFACLKIKPGADESLLVRMAIFVFQIFFYETRDANYFATQLAPLLNFSVEDHMLLLMYAWLHGKRDRPVFPPVLHRLMLSLTRLKARTRLNRSSSSHDDPDCSTMEEDSPHETSPQWLLVLERDVLECRGATAQLLSLSLVVRAVLIQTTLEEEKIPSVSGEDAVGSLPSAGADYEVISTDVSRWDCLIGMLYVLLKLDCLRLAIDNTNRRFVALSDALASAKAVIVDSVAASLLGGSVTPSEVEQVLSGDGAESAQTEISGAGTDASWKSILGTFGQQFPFLLASDNILASCGWECVTRWAADKSKSDWLPRACLFLRDISNPILQHGVCFLIWRTYLAGLFEKTGNLVHKVGRFPKDRLCRRDLGLPDDKLLTFASGCSEVLQIMYEANSQYDAVSQPVFVTEDILENFQSHFGSSHSTSTTAQLPLFEIAYRQKATNYHLTRHQWSLASVLRLSLRYELRPAKPLDLYDDKGKRALFSPLLSHPLLPHSGELDPSEVSRRNRFFHQCIKALVDQEFVEIEDSTPSPIITTGVSDLSRLTRPPLHVKDSPGSDQPASPRSPDIDPILQLVSEWAMDKDVIYRLLIIELYAAGRDRVAERYMHLAKHKPALASEMLFLAGERIQVKMTGNPLAAHGSTLVTLLTSTLETWLSSMDTSRIRSTEYSRDDMLRLLSYCLSMLPQDSGEYNIARQLPELVKLIKF